MIEFEPTANSDLVSFKKNNYHSINTDKNVLNITVGKSSILSVLFNFLNITVGIGILSLPYSMATTGFISCFICLILFGIVSTYTLNLLVISANKANIYNYEGLAEYCFGSFGYIITSFLIFVMVFGGLITEFIAIGDASFKIMQIWGYNSSIERQIIMFIISTIIVLPLCLFRDLSSLEHISAFKIISIVFIISVVIYQWFYMTNNIDTQQDNNNNTGIELNHITFLHLNGLPQSLGIIAFSFLCHDCVFLMYNTLHNPTLKRWKKVSSTGISGTILLNLMFAIPAFLTFGTNCDPNIINNYPVTDPIFISVRIVIIIIMALSYPPAFFLVRHIVYSSTQKAYSSFIDSRYYNYAQSKTVMMHGTINDVNTNERIIDVANITTKYMTKSVQNAPLSHHLIFTLIVFFTNLGIALFIDNLGIAMSLIGSISSINLELVLPALIYIKICFLDENMFDPFTWHHANLKEKLYLVIITKELIFPIILVIIGTIFAITGVLSSFNLF